MLVRGSVSKEFVGTVLTTQYKFREEAKRVEGQQEDKRKTEARDPLDQLLEKMMLSARTRFGGVEEDVADGLWLGSKKCFRAKQEEAPVAGAARWYRTKMNLGPRERLPTTF